MAAGAGVGRREDAEEVADLDIAPTGKTQARVGLDGVDVAAAGALAVKVTGVDEVGDEALCRAFGDPDGLGDVAHPDVWVIGDDEECEAVVGEKGPLKL